MIKKDNLIFIEKAMSIPKIVNLVEKASESIWYKLPDVTSFEHTCYVNIGKEIMEKGVESIEGVALHYIRRAAARHLKRTRYEAPETFSNLAIYDQEDDEEIEFEVEDVLADVEEILLEEEKKKEAITLLAKDDRRRKIIVYTWMTEDRNDLELSRTLARVLGGKVQSHRRFIQRFEKQCREIYTAATI